MCPVLVRAPDAGLNCLVPINMMDLREAADGSYNVFYEKGIARTAPGYLNWNTSSALNSGDLVLGFFTCTVNNSDYLLAVTRQKIYRRDFVNSEWDDVTQSGLTHSSDVDHPLSWTVISHDDTAIYYNDDSAQTHAYEHVIVCDGGLTNIQRWAGEGEADFADLLGAGGYSGETRHRALQVSTTQNRLILISPMTYDASSRTWVENRVRVQWPQVGKLESWTGTGAGAVDLRATGGINVWSAPLAGEFYVYQNNSIWNLRYVAGSAIFDPRPVVHDLGLLSHHLLVPHGNVHYFVGSDFNVYAYYGGTIKKPIGDKIKDYLYRDMERDHLKRCWIELDVNAERLGIFFVPDGEDYASRAYWYDMLQGSWMLADYYDLFTTRGITAVGRLGTVAGTTGPTYAHVLTHLSPYDISDAADATERYGDVLCDTSRTLTSEVSTGVTWCAGGTYASCATGAFLTDMTVGDIMLVQDGSLYTNTRYGSHYYTISDLSNIYITLDSKEPSLAVSDTTAAPAGVPFTVWTDTGDSYAQNLENYETKESFVIGSDDGYLYAFDDSLSGQASAGGYMNCIHKTPVYDGGMPDALKRWPGIKVTARKPSADMSGKLHLYYRTAQYDSTALASWTRIDATTTLDTTWTVLRGFVNRTSRSIQFSIMNEAGTTWEVREIELMQPHVQEDR